MQAREGTIIRILERGVTQIVGTFTESANFGFVIPDDKKFNGDIFIPKPATNGAVEGHKVVVKIIEYPEGRKSAEGEVIQILGIKMIRVSISYLLFINMVYRQNSLKK